MCIEAAKAFIERIKNDEEFARKIMAESTAESRMVLARGEGFNLRAEDVQFTEELTEGELNLVTGGTQSNSLAFLSAYWRKIPIFAIRLEAWEAYRALGGEDDFY